MGSVGRERKADGLDLQDTRQGGKPEAGRADRELGLGSVQEEGSLGFGCRRPQGLALWPQS